MTEVWKDIPGYEGLYQASNLGRVKSLSRVIRNHFRPFRIRERVLSTNGSKKDDDYLSVSLCKQGIQKQLSVHRLVWISFNGPILEGLEPNHKNGVKSDNRLDNLELMTHKENMTHASKNGLLKSKSGENNGRAKLTDDEVREIREIYEELKTSSGTRRGKRKRAPFGTKALLSKKYNVTEDTIKQIIAGNTWGHLC